jgi:hypothetical protein
MQRLQRTHFWLIAILVVSLMSCQKELKQQLMGDWKFKNAVDPELQDSFGALSESLGVDVDVLPASSITNPYFENNYLQFEENTCSVLLGASGHALSGSWIVSDSLITINDTNQKEELQIKIIQLTEDLLKVNLVSNDTTFNAGKIEIEFVKAKK